MEGRGDGVGGCGWEGGGLVWGVVLGGLGGVPMVWPSGVWMVGRSGAA